MSNAPGYAPVEVQLRAAADRALALAHVHAGERVLDVCCGGGNAAAAALDLGASVIGVDVDESMLQIARERLPTVRLQAADAMHLPFEDDSFDVAVSTFGVSYLPGEPAARELVRVVRDGGRVVIASWPAGGSILSAGGLLRRAELNAHGRPAIVSNPTDWYDRRTVHDLFAPHTVEFYDEQVSYQAASARAVADEYFDHHPQWLSARQLVGETAYALLREQTERRFAELNEHPSEWRATDSYLVAVATLDSVR